MVQSGIRCGSQGPCVMDEIKSVASDPFLQFARIQVITFFFFPTGFLFFNKCLTAPDRAVYRLAAIS